MDVSDGVEFGKNRDKVESGMGNMVLSHCLFFKFNFMNYFYL